MINKKMNCKAEEEYDEEEGVEIVRRLSSRF